MFHAIPTSNQHAMSTSFWRIHSVAASCFRLLFVDIPRLSMFSIAIRIKDCFFWINGWPQSSSLLISVVLTWVVLTSLLLFEVFHWWNFVNSCAFGIDFYSSTWQESHHLYPISHKVNFCRQIWACGTIFKIQLHCHSIHYCSYLWIFYCFLFMLISIQNFTWCLVQSPDARYVDHITNGVWDVFAFDNVISIIWSGIVVCTYNMQHLPILSSWPVSESFISFSLDCWGLILLFPFLFPSYNRCWREPWYHALFVPVKTLRFFSLSIADGSFSLSVISSE